MNCFGPRSTRCVSLPAQVLLFGLCLLLPIAVRARDNWIEVHSPNFIVISNAGDHDARKIAAQFEQFREVFQAAFPKIRVDLGKPLVIFALKNEDSMKLFLPGFWEGKNHAHPAGIYVPGEDKHFVAVRTDMSGNNPYEVVYHEYTHALMDLNFRGLPLWFSEGVAEFFGNSALLDKEVAVGIVSYYHLRVIQQNRLIPIETLLQVDHNSPYYNEQDRTSVFYAESWAIVHYLMMDPDAKKMQLLQQFMDAWDATGNQVEAAQKAFGDLNKFGSTIERYTHQNNLLSVVVSTSVHADPKTYTNRPLSQAEADTARGEFYVHTRRPVEAKAALDSAVHADPNLPAVHEALGELAYNEQKLDVAEMEFSRAIDLNSSNFLAYFDRARSRMPHGMVSNEDAAQVTADLEKAIRMNPNFAPAYSVLASVYSQRPETRAKAFENGRKAVLLEPGNLAYAINFGYVLLNAGKLADAKLLAVRIANAAKTPYDQSLALRFSQMVTTREVHEQQLAASAEAIRKERDGAAEKPAPPARIPTATAPGTSPIGANPTRTGPREYSLEGKVASVDCPGGNGGKLTLSINSVLMKFHYLDLSKVQVVPSVRSASGAVPACAAWKGQRAKITFEPQENGDYDGELASIQFF